jgi:hypothetical protein
MRSSSARLSALRQAIWLDHLLLRANGIVNVEKYIFSEYIFRLNGHGDMIVILS